VSVSADAGKNCPHDERLFPLYFSHRYLTLFSVNKVSRRNVAIRSFRRSISSEAIRRYVLERNAVHIGNRLPCPDGASRVTNTDAKKIQGTTAQARIRSHQSLSLPHGLWSAIARQRFKERCMGLLVILIFEMMAVACDQTLELRQ
jgi:hypothetical protein